jgi:uncharacterized damage-inducible protein DinB
VGEQHVYEAAAELSQDERDRDMGAFFKSMTGTLNHLLVADRIWMKRFTGDGQAPASLDTILFSDFAPLQTARAAEDQRIRDWVSGLDGKALAGRFTYLTATDMRTISQRLAPALAHLFNHQTHHRGQAHTPHRAWQAFIAARPDLFPAHAGRTRLCLILPVSARRVTGGHADHQRSFAAHRRTPACSTTPR